MGSTVGSVFGWDGCSVDETKVMIVKGIVKTRFMQLVNGEAIADPIHLFIKREPHKLQKIEEGRLRLISGVSLTDALIDRMIFGKFFERALGSLGQTHALLGWTPLQGGRHILMHEFPHGVTSVDKSAWDWSVPEWMVQMFLDVTLELMDDEPDFVKDVIKLRFKLLFELAEFSDGNKVVKQSVVGIMKSGCYLTLMMNTMGQIILWFMCCERLGWDPNCGMPWSFGDDTIQDSNFDIPAYVDALKAFGFTPKVSPTAAHIEFVGFLMDYEKVIPAYWRKHLFCLAYLDESVATETLDAYQQLYYACPEMLNIIQQELRARDLSAIRSARWLRGQQE